MPAAAVVLHGAYETMCATLMTGAVLCWGENDSGEIGLGNLDSNEFVNAPHWVDSPFIVLGRDESFGYFNGNRIWGQNSVLDPSIGHGRLGQGNLDDVLEPTLVCIPEH